MVDTGIDFEAVEELREYRERNQPCFYYTHGPDNKAVKVMLTKSFFGSSLLLVG